MVISASNNSNANSNSSSKKRKICRKEDDEVEDQEREDDEAKMETFFALVRKIRETRDPWINSRSGDDSKNKRVCKNTADKYEENRVATVWKPTFQLEDFAEEKAQQCQNRPHHHPTLPLLAGASQSNNSAKEDDAEKGIDLRLSL